MTNIDYNPVAPFYLREDFSDWILAHHNVKTSCVSSDVDNVLSSKSNQKELFPKMLMGVMLGI